MFQGCTAGKGILEDVGHSARNVHGSELGAVRAQVLGNLASALLGVEDFQVALKERVGINCHAFLVGKLLDGCAEETIVANLGQCGKGEVGVRRECQAIVVDGLNSSVIERCA